MKVISLDVEIILRNGYGQFLYLREDEGGKHYNFVQVIVKFICRACISGMVVDILIEGF